MVKSRHLGGITGNAVMDPIDNKYLHPTKAMRPARIHPAQDTHLMALLPFESRSSARASHQLIGPKLGSHYQVARNITQVVPRAVVDVRANGRFLTWTVMSLHLHPLDSVTVPRRGRPLRQIRHEGPCHL